MKHETRVAIAKTRPETFRVHGEEVYFKNNLGVFILWTDDNGLNAIHEAEKLLPIWESGTSYAGSDRHYKDNLFNLAGVNYWRATEDQRGEALLLTLIC